MTKRPLDLESDFSPLDIPTAYQYPPNARCKGLINLYQTNEQRRLKYHLCRVMGKNSYWSFAMRDWNWNTIARFFGYKSWKELALALSD